MSKTKGTDVIALRSLVHKKGPEAEKALSELLGPRLENIYNHIHATSWTEIDDQLAIYEAAAKILFPEPKDRMLKLGMALAEKTYSGIYKIFLRLPTPEYVFGRAAIIWNTYYERGDASVESLPDNYFQMVVRNMPELPAAMREVIRGHYMVILKIIGAKNIDTMEVIDDDPMAWRWRGKLER